MKPTPNGKPGRPQIRRWMHKIDDAVRECQQANVPFVIIALNPANGRPHGGFTGEPGVVKRILLGVATDLRNQEERARQRALLVDPNGDPLAPTQKEEGP